MRAIPPKTDATCLVGRKVQNVGGKWYINAGTFCCRCQVAYTFEDSHRLFKRDKEMGRKCGIPRCLYCGQSLRTRSKPNSKSGFWDKLKELKGIV